MVFVFINPPPGLWEALPAARRGADRAGVRVPGDVGGALHSRLLLACHAPVNSRGDEEVAFMARRSARRPRVAATIRLALDPDIDYFDTADMYDPYHNEELLGRAVAAHRHAVVISTKSAT